MTAAASLAELRQSAKNCARIRSGSPRRSRDDQAGKEKSDCGGKQTVSAKSVDNECLQIEEDECSGKHQPNSDTQKCSGARVIEDREDREAKNTEIAKHAEERDRRGTDMSVFACQHLRATDRAAANCRLTGQMQNCQIKRV